MEPQMNADPPNNQSSIIHNQFDISRPAFHTGIPCEWNSA